MRATACTWALELGAKRPLEWTPDHEAILHTSDQLWDDLRGAWIRGLQLEAAREDLTGDEALLAARAAHREAEAAVDAAFESRRTWRQRNRRGGSTPEIEAALDAACEERRLARKTLGIERKRVRESIRPDLLRIWRARDAVLAEIAAGRGRRYPLLHWAQANDVLARFRVAAAEAAKKWRVVRPSREHPSESIYCQLMARSVGGQRIERPGRRARIEGGTLTGTTWERLTTRRRGVRIEPYRPNEQIAERNRWGLLVVPADSRELEIRLPVRLDREPQVGSLVKGVRVVRRSAREWHAVLSIQGPVLTPIARPTGGGTLYCGLNWRRVRGGGLRVLDGIDDAGFRVQVVLPPEHVAAVAWADTLQSALDRCALDAAALATRSQPARGAEIAEWVRRRDWEALREGTWRWPGDEGRLLRYWSDGIVHGSATHDALLRVRRQAEGDVEKQALGVAEMLGDRVGRQHLEGQRSKAIRRREDLYRRSAHWIASRYARVVLAESDGSELARVTDPETGAETDLPLPARRARQMAAPYSLAQALRWALTRSGGVLEERPAIDASHTCPLCRAEMERSPGDRAALILRCSDHGVWDRDHALALALWRDDEGAADRERWRWHAEAEERSRAQIVSVCEEIREQVPNGGAAWSRLRYVSGVSLANPREQ